jgi:hypothetical protein
LSGAPGEHAREAEVGDVAGAAIVAEENVRRSMRPARVGVATVEAKATRIWSR